MEEVVVRVKFVRIITGYICYCVMPSASPSTSARPSSIYRGGNPRRSNLSSSGLHLRVNHTVVSRLRLLRELIHWGDRHHVASHNVLANIPRQLLGVVLRVLSVANVEDSVQLLQSEGFCLWQQEVAIDSPEQIPAGVPAEGSGGSESGAQRGPAEGDDEVEAPAGGGCKGHTDVADVEWESFGGVSERNRAFGGRVDGHEAEDGSGDAPKLRRVCFRPFLRRSASD
jgi:hypothetical protein